MGDTSSQPITVAVVAADLIFAARIRAAANAAGVRARFARTDSELLDAAADADLVIVDLDARWVDPSQSIQRLKQAGKPIVAFVSHVRAAAIEAARAAGADRVLARSVFVRLLPEIMSGGQARSFPETDEAGH
jgi:CheY-like chemotaxis protein